MSKRRILSFILCAAMLGACLPGRFALAAEEKTQRTAYLHAQGENPSETPDVSNVYMGENTDLYFAVDNPNKGDYENGVHKEPQYDMNGYTLTVYFDPAYFDYASDTSAPIDYTVPDKNLDTSGIGSEETGSGEVDDVPTEAGYYAYRQGSGSKVISGKTYKSAYLTVFFSGGYVPQKKEGSLWYNLCKLPLKPLKTGSTTVFFDTSGEEGETLELFAKNKSEELNEQTFEYAAVNGGYHNIVIKDKSKPAAPNANPPAGSYTEKQYVELTAEPGCKIWYSLDGREPSIEYTGDPIEIEMSAVIRCYAERISDGKKSNTISFEYRILPKAPYLFADKNGTKALIPNIYNENNVFKVYAADKNVFGNIDDGSEVYYTFSGISEENITLGTDPETEWVKLDKRNPSIDITKKRTVRLITDKMGEFSEVSEYHLGVKPEKVSANYPSGEYDGKIDVSLSCVTTGAKIYYTTDGSDPIANGMEYHGTITFAKDTTLRAVALYDGIYSEVSSFYYIFKGYDDYGVDAFYPPGGYEGSVSVTLTAHNPENKIEYRLDGDTEWHEYSNETWTFDKDTVVYARAVDKNGVEGETYRFDYYIKPLPPQFAPESTQFTNASEITVYCVESTKDTTDRFDLYYTVDGSDPVTSTTRIKADDSSDSAVIEITKYTVVSAVVLKDKMTYSNVVTHSYDIVTKKPTRPLTTLAPGRYIRKIGTDEGFSTQFMPVPNGTDIYYTVSHDGSFLPDPIPNTSETIKYEGNPIEVKGHTIIKAIAVNIFGIKSDVGIFEYIVAPETPFAAPSAVIGGDRLPVVPVSAVKGSTVKYEINGFENRFECADGNFYIDTRTGSAYKDKECTIPLGTVNPSVLSAPAVLNISAELDGIESDTNRYTYSLNQNASEIAPPYADKDTGEYEEIKADDDNNLLIINLYSLNNGDKIQYRTDNNAEWETGTTVKIKQDTILQIRSEKNGVYSSVISYVYTFIPLAPVITLPSGRYLVSDNKTTEIEYDGRAPSDKIADGTYSIWFRKNGDKQDFHYNDQAPSINHTMSFKAYVYNSKTGRTSKNTIHYYIIESDGAASGSVYVASPYDVSRISADVLDTGEYAKGIKLLTQNKNASIHYFYTYTQLDMPDSITTQNLVYDNTPITVNPSMTSITITAWLEDADGRIANSDFTHTIEFVHLNVPQTSLGSEKVEYSSGTKYTIINDYPDDENILLYYTLDGTDPVSSNTRKLYNGEELTITEAVTVKAVYLSVCGKCVECKNDNPEGCWSKVYGKTGTYRYTIPTVIRTGGGGGGGTKTVDKTRKYTKDIFGNEHPTHIGYINGYPDGSVKPDGEITREEMAAVLYRITNHEYEKPFVATGEAFPDVTMSRWSAHDIEYMTDKDVIYGYPDGEFKPANNLTRAEFATLICRFAKLEDTDEEIDFPDMSTQHWAYDYVARLAASGLMQGYEDGTYRPEREITRAEVMTVVNKLLGRKPSEPYVKSLGYNPYNDIDKDKWHYVTVLEATITHNYYLDNDGWEIKWEDCK